jgi:hypothetical protein
MKTMLMIMAMLIQQLALADSVDVKNYWFNGQEQSAQMLLHTEKTKLEYRTVTVPATCYRTEYRRQCSQQPGQCRQVCNNGQCRQVCSPPQTVCRNIPVNVPYPCYRTETRSYRVHDYYVETFANLNFDLANVTAGAAEDFKVRVEGEQDGITVATSKNYLVLLTDRSRQEVRHSGVKQVNLTYNLAFANAASINRVLAQGIKNVSLKAGVLTFELGSGFNLNDYIQNLKVYSYRRASSDILLFNRNLMPYELEIQDQGMSSLVTVNLNSLGINVPSRARVILETQYNVEGAKVLNPNDVKTQTNVNWILNNQ